MGLRLIWWNSLLRFIIITTNYSLFAVAHKWGGKRLVDVTCNGMHQQEYVTVHDTCFWKSIAFQPKWMRFWVFIFDFYAFYAVKLCWMHKWSKYECAILFGAMNDHDNWKSGKKHKPKIPRFYCEFGWIPRIWIDWNRKKGDSRKKMQWTPLTFETKSWIEKNSNV